MAIPYAAFETHLRQGGAVATAAAGAFFMGTDPVHETLHDVAARLDAAGIPYAVCGGMRWSPTGTSGRPSTWTSSSPPPA